ncbi:hypothetical protein GW901_01170 [Candidatus Parcubacteria bacterium]|nr:hypothetical protein [Candidatus Parcubacteria bacterium]
MIVFDSKYFKKFEFKPKQTEKYLQAAYRDLKITNQSGVAEVEFQFAYNALIKLGIALISRLGYKVKSRSGHHIKILEKMALILDDKDIYSVGNKMRKKRNTDLYEGGVLISEKEAKEYRDWLKAVFLKAERHLFGANKLL